MGDGRSTGGNIDDTGRRRDETSEKNTGVGILGLALDLSG
jgi:hypothetical protein